MVVDTRFRFMGAVVKNLTATAGTVNAGNARLVKVQACLDGNSSFEVAILPTRTAAGTVSKASAAAFLSDGGVYDPVRPAGGVGTWYLAYKTYSGATVAIGTSANDKLMCEKYG